MNLKNKKILITGSDGFIGSHLAETLARDGHDVRAFVYYNSFNSWGWLDSLPESLTGKMDIVSGDIRDPHRVKKAMKDCDVVFHLAALIAIPYSYHSPDSYVDTNVKGTLNMLQAARELGVSKVVHTSTSEVYGSAQRVPIDEEHPLQGQSPYSASKIGADQMAAAFHRSFSLPVATIRPFNTYGPRQSARAVIPTIITQLAAGKKKIRLGALHPTRDFTFIEDTVRGFIRVAESDRSVGEVINIGSNFEVTVKQTAELIAELMGVDFKIEAEDERKRPAKSEVERLWADNRKAKKLAGWSPRYGGVAGFKKGLKETIDWFTRSENLTRYKTELCNI